MNRGKGILATSLLLAALAGGLCFANWLTSWLLGLNDVSLAWNTWWQYFRVKDLPQFAPFATRILLAGGIGFGVPMMTWLLLLIPMFRSKEQSLHGDASFADMRDLKKAGLLTRTSQSILIGNFRGHSLWLSGAQHVIVIAPTRSGKTTSLAIPVLLTYGHSIIVLDLKGELRKATSGQRLAMGQCIVVWAPYDEEGRTHRFNPLTLLNGMDPGKRLGEIQTIAAILYPDEAGKDPFWTSQSRAAFTAFASYMFESWDEALRRQKSCVAPEHLPQANTSESFPSLERILRLSSGCDGKNTKEMLDDILTHASYAYISPQTRTVFSNLTGLAEQTFSSVIATMQAPLQQFLSPVLAAATNATDFDITTFRKRPTTLYVDIPTKKLDESGKLLNIFFSSVIGNNLGK